VVKVTIAGGGTAGHVFNGLALADRLRVDHDAEVGFIGSPDGQEAGLIPAAGYPFHPVRARKMTRELSWRTASAPLVAVRSMRECRPLVATSDVVVGMGGYVSAPAVLAARRAGIPIVLHEQNAIPGLANRLLARVAAAAGLTFTDAASRLPRGLRTVVTGNPVRDRIRAVPENRSALIAEAMEVFDLDPDRRTVIVFGGSQGARRLDEAVALMLPVLRDRSDLQLLVSTGPAHVRILQEAVEVRAPLRVRAYGSIDRMDLAYAAAALAVARAGANSISELTVCGVPTILVPYPHAAANHQEANARELVRAGAAEMMLDASLDPGVLAARIGSALDDERRLAAMRTAARGWAKPDADRRLADLVAQVAA
jgi:UDP-N-acetylglucosamine--N-acetylmuramyl-(pentapeptide) pyrophosphoryl-undecaprenol N-acetylglucosamine transferase